MKKKIGVLLFLSTILIFSYKSTKDEYIFQSEKQKVLNSKVSQAFLPVVSFGPKDNLLLERLKELSEIDPGNDSEIAKMQTIYNGLVEAGGGGKLPQKLATRISVIKDKLESLMISGYSEGAASELRSLAELRLEKETKGSLSIQEESQNPAVFNSSKIFSVPSCAPVNTVGLSIQGGLAINKLGEPGAETESLIAKLSQPEDVVAYYRENITIEPLLGLAQNANTLLARKRGTTADITNSLSTAFKQLKIPNYIVSGEIRLEETDIRQLFGTVDEISSLWAVSQYVAYFDGDPYFYKQGNKTFVRLPHYWVVAFIDGSWTEIDPIKFSRSDYKSYQDTLPDFGDEEYINGWLFDENELGRVIKPGSLAQDNYRRLQGVIPVQRRIRSSKVIPRPMGLLENSEYCFNEFLQDGFAGTEHSFKSEFTIWPTSSSPQSKTYDTAEIVEEIMSVSHTSGLINDNPNSTAGSIQLKKGDTVVLDIPATNQLDIDFAEKIIRPFTTSSFENKFPYKSGSVLVINHAIIPAEMNHVMDFKGKVLKEFTDTANPLSAKEKMIKTLRLAGLLFAAKIERIASVLKEQRGMYISPALGTTTYSTKGFIRDLEDRLLGEVPLASGITAIVYWRRYSKFRSDFSRSEDKNSAIAGAEYIISASHAEDEIWEELYGVPGFSANKVLQTGVDFSRLDPSHENFDDYKAIKGVELTDDNLHCLSNSAASGCNAKFESISDSQIIAAIEGTYQKSGFGEGSLLYTIDRPLKVVTLFGGQGTNWEGIGYILANPDTGFSGALFNTIGEGPLTFGGGSVGTPKQAQVEPDDQNISAQNPTSPEIPTSECPVNFATGSMWHNWFDYSINGKTSSTNLEFVRTYLTKPSATFSELGSNWIYNWETRLLNEAKGPLANNGSENIRWITETGGEQLFTRRSADPLFFDPPKNFFDELEETPTEYILHRKQGIKYYFHKTSGVLNGRLDRIVEPHGVEINLSYDVNGYLTEVSEPYAGSLIIERDAQDKIIGVSSTLNKNSVSFNFKDGKLVESIDVDGDATTYEYLPDTGKSAKDGFLQAFTSPEGRRVEFQYYHDGRVFREITPGGGVQSYLYAPYENLMYTKVVGPDGRVTQYNFDDKYRIYEVIHPDRSRVQTLWDPVTNQKISETDSLGFETQFTYDSRGNLTGIKRPEDSGFKQFTYNQTYDRLTKVDSLIDSDINYTIDPQTGDATRVSQLVSGQEEFIETTYDAFGNPLSFKTNLGFYRDFRDSEGRLVVSYDKRNPQTMRYDSRNRLVEQSDQSGRRRIFSYDEEDRVTGITDTSGPDSSNEYDRAGRLISSKLIADGTVQQTRFQYDKRDRLTTTIDALNNVSTRSFDRKTVGCRITPKPTKVTDSLGRETHFVYDEMFRKIKQISPEGRITRFSYNLRGDLISTTDPEGHRTEFKYDGNRRIIERSSPSLRTDGNGRARAFDMITKWTYDDEDRPIRQEDILFPGTESHVMSFEYDSAGRLTRRKQTLEVNNVEKQVFEDSTFRYSPLFGVQLMTEANNEDYKLKFSYESLPPYALTGYSGEPADSANSLGLLSFNHTVEPSLYGKPQIIKDGNGLKLTSRYSSNGLLSKIVGQLNSHTYQAEISYDGFNRKNTIINESKTTTMNYDLLNRPVAFGYIGSSVIGELNLSYNAVGNIDDIQYKNGSGSPGGGSLTYNLDDEITDAQHVTREEYEYDKAGNRTSVRYNSSSTTNYEYISNGLVEEGGSPVYRTLDGTGRRSQITRNLPNLGNRTLTFDYRPDSKMIGAKVYGTGVDPETEVTYVYDALNRRIAKRVIAPSTGVNSGYSAVHLGLRDQILLSKSSFNTEQTLHIDGEGVDEHFGYVRETGPKTSYVTDHLGTVIDRTNPGFTYYPPFGAKASVTVGIPSYGYTGREYDPELDLYYYRARHYDYKSGRFIQRDPIGLAGGDSNLFRYVGNNPISFTDPNGEAGVKVGGAATLAYFNFGGTVSAGLAATVDKENGFQVGGFFEVEGRAGVGFGEVSAGIDVTVSPDAKNLAQLAGISKGGGVVAPISFGGVSSVSVSSGSATGVTVNFGRGVGLMGFGTVSNTSITEFGRVPLSGAPSCQ